MIFFIFVLFFLLAEAIVFGVRFALRKFNIKIWLRIIIAIIELVLALLLAYLSMATYMLMNLFFGPLAFALYIALLMDAVAQILYLIVFAFIGNKKKTAILTSISGILGTAFLVFGMINSQIVSPKYISFSSEKLSNSYKFAFVSDMHVGKAQPLSTSIKTVESIKAQNPDFTIIGGDLIDEYTTRGEMKEVVKAFSTFTSPVYFVRGNHDLNGQVSNKELEDELIASGIHVVIDEFIPIGTDLTLLGRNDLDSPTRKKIDELVNPYPSTFLLTADHQPFEFDIQAKAGIDLQLSGHTHAGQLFPLKTLYQISIYSYGEYHYENSILNVSSGASGWQNPYRSEVGCQYEIITLNPSK